jgi:hypothetical protein
LAREKAAERRGTQPRTRTDPGRSVIARVFARARIFDAAAAPVVREPESARRNLPEAGHTSVLGRSSERRDQP